MKSFGEHSDRKGCSFSLEFEVCSSNFGPNWENQTNSDLNPNPILMHNGGG